MANNAPQLCALTWPETDQLRVALLRGAAVASAPRTWSHNDCARVSETLTVLDVVGQWSLRMQSIENGLVANAGRGRQGNGMVDTDGT